MEPQLYVAPDLPAPHTSPTVRRCDYTNIEGQWIGLKLKSKLKTNLYMPGHLDNYLTETNFTQVLPVV